MNGRRATAVIGIGRLLVAVLFVITVLGGALAVVLDPTGRNAFRWIMAMLFIGAPLAYVWRLRDVRPRSRP